MTRHERAATTTADAQAAPAAPTTTLTLVRHGQTYLNARRLMQGSCDSPLTRTGRLGVQSTARHLEPHSFHAAYSSPQGRAVMTAVEIVRRHEGLRLRTHEGLREVSFGIYERRPEHELDRHEPWSRLVPAMLAGTHPGLPNGESGADYMARVRRAFTEIVAAHPGEDVLVVGHGVTLGAYLSLVGHDGLAALPNASVSRVAVSDGVARILEVGTDVAGHGSLAARPAPAPDEVAPVAAPLAHAEPIPA
ncbi:MAG TPA: histidine phosphatase family protein [Micrococcales bacterium]|uniref:histidine phosphatase family protein n=1 Tax=Miniimonas TaxID=947525 RepID=UPI000D5299CF|nr:MULTISPECIES: histidine phosphatase family protein [Miniimonas]HCX84280.1 histidine phosphatase family protein [Micrococcales bacterium]